MPTDDKAIAWGYGDGNGPAEWAQLADDFATCHDGRSQSPIDIVTGHVVSGARPPILSWGPQRLEVVDTGRSIQANVSPGNTTVLDGTTYELVQFHWHRPSEHTVDGTTFDMELHLVHEDADGNLAVLGVLLEAGEANPASERFWGDGPTVSVTDFDPSVLLPRSLEGWRYDGSLTTPPCSEGVVWFVLSSPARVSPGQIDSFPYEGTARPTQALNGRTVIGP